MQWYARLPFEFLKANQPLNLHTILYLNHKFFLKSSKKFENEAYEDLEQQ